MGKNGFERAVNVDRVKHQLFDKCSECGEIFLSGDTITFRDKKPICRKCVRKGGKDED